MAPTNVDATDGDPPSFADAIQGLQPARLKVSDAPWSRFLMVEKGPLSPDKHRYRIMLAIQKLTVNCSADGMAPDHAEPDHHVSSSVSNVVFARLPSGYFVIVVKSQNERPGTAKYNSVVLTSAVSFRFTECPPVVYWVKENAQVAIHLNTSYEFWAAIRCVGLARTDYNCDPVLRLAHDELQTLQAQLEYIENKAFISALEQSTTTI